MRLIDADALYNRFWERPWYDNADRDECACVDVDNAPTVDAVHRVHAKWVDGKCSNCGTYIPTDDAHDAIFESECHFCYYCGARMDGGGGGVDSEVD